MARSFYRVVKKNLLGVIVTKSVVIYATCVGICATSVVIPAKAKCCSLKEFIVIAAEA
jgi:hypothetical protein